MRGVSGVGLQQQDGGLWVVVGSGGCQVRTGPTLASPAVCFLAPGTIIGEPKERIGRRCRITSPVSGWCSEWTTDGQPILTPSSNYSWQRWGKTRLHVGTCGHAVHEDCWDSHFARLTQMPVCLP